MPKTVIIGGGSYTWGPIFLRDILSTPGLKGSVIVLEDVVQDRVDVVYALGQKMIDDFGLDFHLEKTLSLDEALNGADFIILTITTGRLESMRPDVEIPMKYGIKQSVGDTTGPGGLSRALRNIPVVAEIGRKVMERSTTTASVTPRGPPSAAPAARPRPRASAATGSTRAIGLRRCFR